MLRRLCLSGHQINVGYDAIDLSGGVRFSHVCSISHDVLTVRTDPDCLSAKRSEHAHVSVGHEAVAIVAVSHTPCYHWYNHYTERCIYNRSPSIQ